MNKKFVAFPGLTPLQPGGDVHPCKQACLTELPHPSGLPLADGKLQSKIAAVGSTKRLPWSHNDILRLVKAPPLSSSVLPSRQQYRMWDYPGTPPPSVYQVTHGTALQAAECYVQQYILMRMNYHITRTQYTLLCLEGNHITITHKRSGAWRALL